MKHYQQLSYEQRYPMKRRRLCQIYLLKQEGYNQQATADAIGICQSTIVLKTGNCQIKPERLHLKCSRSEFDNDN